MQGYDQMKENRSLSSWGWTVPIVKTRRFSCLLRLSSPQDLGEIAQTFMSEIENGKSLRFLIAYLAGGGFGIKIQVEREGEPINVRFSNRQQRLQQFGESVDG